MSRVAHRRMWTMGVFLMINNGAFVVVRGARSWGGGPHRRLEIKFFKSTGVSKTQFSDGGWGRKNENPTLPGFKDKEEARRPTRAPGPPQDGSGDDEVARIPSND